MTPTVIRHKVEGDKIAMVITYSDKRHGFSSVFQVYENFGGDCGALLVSSPWDDERAVEEFNNWCAAQAA